ncbi:MAG: ABC transporter permease [Proteobacteria bacterium]|jgi:oligopeptide transport system permease protein|nr:ABC transporter permease [Pseudomonadota bacterium]
MSAQPSQKIQHEIVEGVSLWQDAWKRLKKNKASVISFYVVIFMVLACLIGPILLNKIAGYDVTTQDLAYGPKPPSWAHPFGTDYFGRDLLTRVLVGGCISLMVGLIAAMVAAVVGTIYGAISGYVGKRMDNVMMRVVDTLYALPYMFLVIIIVTAIEDVPVSSIFEPFNFVSRKLFGLEIFEGKLIILFFVLGFVGWLTTARIVRGQVLSLKEQEFVLASRSLGVRGLQIIFRHLIPNALGPIIVYFTLTVPSMIMQEAFLSFIGLGVQPPNPSLGSLINDGANQMNSYWWILVFPSAFLAILLFCLNFIGDGLRDALDPKQKRG